MSIATRINTKLTEALAPTRLELVDESAHHAGHAGMQGLAAQETHFRLTVEAEGFRGMTRVQRQRLIYQILAQELADGVHALAISARVPGE
ncbi:BolA family protein [Ferrovibrio terrae]|jgi:BolA protein|uniref:BolA family protein n=1 Tax=Ferrovibrio terrae TaxID=2594003 RepID=UPI003137DE1B